MRVNADFSDRIVLRPDDYEWHDTPAAGVERMMFDRIGGEVARATSLVRFAPNASFAAHTHGGGEEFYVLEGEFGDEHRRYPSGCYVRNPVGTSHTPRIGGDGCVIFVKLYQMDADDRHPVVIDTRREAWQPGQNPGVEVQHLHEYGGERVALLRWSPGAALPPHGHPGGEEILVLDGSFHDEFGDYPAGSWIRSPHGSTHTPCAGADGTLLWIKVGHLPSSTGRYRQLSD